jgi:hypothetical protein
MEAPPLDLPSAALVTQPGDILLTDNLQDENRKLFLLKTEQAKGPNP